VTQELKLKCIMLNMCENKDIAIQDFKNRKQVPLCQE
jgi:hypothetical protein